MYVGPVLLPQALFLCTDPSYTCFIYYKDKYILFAVLSMYICWKINYIYNNVCVIKCTN